MPTLNVQTYVRAYVRTGIPRLFYQPAMGLGPAGSFARQQGILSFSQTSSLFYYYKIEL